MAQYYKIKDCEVVLQIKKINKMGRIQIRL